jgi:hypothetical protein
LSPAAKVTLLAPQSSQAKLQNDTFSSLFSQTKPAASTSAKPLDTPLNRDQHTTSSPSSTSSSSSTASSVNDPTNTVNNHSNNNLNSIDSFITSASIIGGLNPVWSFENNSGDSATAPGLSSLVSPMFNNKLIDDDSILNLSGRNNNSNTSYTNGSLSQFGDAPPTSSNPPASSASSINSNNKPIGYERHEKQINNSINNININNNHNINQFNPGGLSGLNSAYNVNMAIGLQLNNLNLDDFSYMYNNLNDTNFLNNQQQQKANFVQPPPPVASTSKQLDLNALFLATDQSISRVSPPASSSDNTNSLPAFTNQNIQQQQNFQSMPDFSSLPLPLATQWIANMNNNLMNMSSLNNSNPGVAGLNHRAPFVNINQSLSNLLPAFLATSQSMGPGLAGGKMLGQQQGPAAPSPGVFSFPSVEMMGLQQQYQASPLNNLQFQTQFLDSLKNNNVS